MNAAGLGYSALTQYSVACEFYTASEIGIDVTQIGAVVGQLWLLRPLVRELHASKLQGILRRVLTSAVKKEDDDIILGNK